MNTYRKISILLAGIAVLIGGLFLANKSYEFKKNSISTTGEVIEIIRTKDSDSQYMYHPLIKFTTLEGKEVEAGTGMNADRPYHQVGEKVSLRYLISFPERVELDNWISFWLFPTILFIFGLGLTMLGVYEIKKSNSPVKTTYPDQNNHQNKNNY